MALGASGISIKECRSNGRLRRDLPRDLDLDALGDAELQGIVLAGQDLTPRKCLGFLP